MDFVRFAFGARPQIDDLDAEDVCESLRSPRFRNFPAVELVGKIKAELRKAPADRSDIELTDPQLEQLISVLDEDLPKMPKRRPALEHLLAEARAAYERSESAPGE